MEKKIETYRGFITECETFRELTEVAGEYIVSQIYNTFNKGDKVFVRYYLTDKETTLEQVIEANIINIIGGDISELDFVLDAYSEYTINELTEKCVIGGHDLVDILTRNIGKYIILVIETVE